jgi:hypothetical protein
MERAVNEQGYVAMRYSQPIIKEVQVPGGFYTFYPNRNISMCWVKPELVDAVLNVKGGCCGRSNNQVFWLASQSDANIWEGKSER